MIVGLRHPDPNSWEDCKAGYGNTEDLMYFVDEELASATIDNLYKDVHNALGAALVENGVIEDTASAVQFAEQNLSELAQAFSGNGTYLFCGYDLIVRQLRTKVQTSADLSWNYNPFEMEPDQSALDSAKELLNNADHA